MLLHSNNPTLTALALASAEGFRCLSMSAQGHTDTVGGAPCWYCSSAVPVFNGAAILHERVLNPDTLRGIGEYFTSKGRPYSLLTLDGLIPDSAATLRDLGYYQYDHMPSMWLDGLPPMWSSPALDLWVSPVESSPDLATFRSILSSVFHIPPEEIELVLGEGALHLPNVRHYLGWLDGIAVGTLSLVLSGPIPGVWNVATLPLYRRRGVAASMMHTILKDTLDNGHASTMLLASTEGVPLYERLGYTTLSTVRIYLPHSG